MHHLNLGRMTLPDSNDWRRHLLSDPVAIHAALAAVHTIAVLGIKPADTDAPAFYVPEYAQGAGYKIIPVPVYYPDMATELGEKAYQALRDIPHPVDAVLVFRRPPDIPQHLEDILALQPRLVWMQLGIRHDEVAESLAKAGIDVVQDHCVLVELRKMGR